MKSKVTRGYIWSPLDYVVVKVHFLFQMLPFWCAAFYLTAKTMDYLRIEVLEFSPLQNLLFSSFTDLVYGVKDWALSSQNSANILTIYFGLWLLVVLFDKKVVSRLAPHEEVDHIEA